MAPGRCRGMETTFNESSGLYERRIGRKIFLGLLGAGAVGVASGSLLSPVVSGLKTAVKPGDVVPGFTIYTVAPMPVFHPATWRLTVDGLVDHKLSLSYQDLLNLPSLTTVRNYQCVTGWVVQ